VCKKQESGSFVDALLELLAFRQKDRPLMMKVVTNLSEGDKFKFTLVGECPHCHNNSGCVMLGTAYTEKIPAEKAKGSPYTSPAERFCAITQCPACNRHILAVVTRQPHPTSPGQPSREPFALEAYYPMETIDDTVADEIPSRIAGAFKEALRCFGAKAYNATAEMCRRAVDGICTEFGAPKRPQVLEAKIDWMATNQHITPFMAGMAHKIRLGGNRAAHFPDLQKNSDSEPEPDEPEIGEAEAKAIIEFTRELCHHMYVMPQKLQKYDFSKPKKDSPVTAEPA
jgi:hypothetical protein